MLELQYLKQRDAPTQTASVTPSGNCAQALLEFSGQPCFESAEKLKEKCNQHLKR
jgi:hypothetical protein